MDSVSLSELCVRGWSVKVCRCGVAAGMEGLKVGCGALPSGLLSASWSRLLSLEFAVVLGNTLGAVSEKDV